MCVSLYLFQKREHVQREYKTSGIAWQTNITRDGSLLHPSQYWTTVIGPCIACLKSASQKGMMIVSENSWCLQLYLLMESNFFTFMVL